MAKKITGKKLRQVAGGFATGITVVTTKPRRGKVIGMTVNSFVSVSLDPPLVSFCVTTTADFMEHMKIGQPVAISILSSDQQAISNQFAGMNKTDIKVKFDKNGTYHKIADALGWYETVVEGLIPAGDHHLILCRIINLDRDMKKAPILYYSGYKSLG